MNSTSLSRLLNIFQSRQDNVQEMVSSLFEWGLQTYLESRSIPSSPSPSPPRPSFRDVVVEPGEQLDPCCICLSEDTRCVQTECGHVYHRACILKWLDESTTCPICRTVIS